MSTVVKAGHADRRDAGECSGQDRWPGRARVENGNDSNRVPTTIAVRKANGTTLAGCRIPFQTCRTPTAPLLNFTRSTSGNRSAQNLAPSQSSCRNPSRVDRVHHGSMLDRLPATHSHRGSIATSLLAAGAMRTR